MTASGRIAGSELDPPDADPGGGGGRSRRGWIAAFVTVLAIVAVVAALPWLRSQGASYGGPLAEAKVGTGWSLVAVDLSAGDSNLADAGIDVPHHSGGDAILDRAAVLSPTPGMKVVHVAASNCGLGYARGWPPQTCAPRPIRGYVVKPGVSPSARLTILVAFTVTGSSPAGFPGIAFDYHVGSAHYRAISLQGGCGYRSPPPAGGSACPDVDTRQSQLADLLAAGEFDTVYRLAFP